MRARVELPLFLIASLVCCVAVFGDALLGRSLSAPVDIAPALWKHYEYVAPGMGGVPRNHHIVDQLSYDLPVQWLIYQGWRSGEVPWWNPWSLGGRPLLADAHCNGTDPLRLAVYFAVPDFVTAYNWTLALHSLATGLGLFVLLRALGARPLVAGALALAGQFAGGHTVLIGHPWVQGAFLYYPWLWLAWRRGSVAGGALAAAAIFYAGNLQSHAYVAVFAGAWLCGHCGRQHWLRELRCVAPSLLLGAALAAPVLAPQLELYFLNAYTLEARLGGGSLPWPAYHSVLAGAALHPWAMGTFRTVGYESFGFRLCIGGAALALAAFGAFARGDEQWRAARRTGLWLVGAYIVIVSTPLYWLLYSRAAGLGILGLLVLAARGAELLLESREPSRRWARAVFAAVALIVIGTHAMAWFVFPRVRGKLEEKMAARMKDDFSGGASAELRRFQFDNFSREVTFANPEALLNALALALAALLFARPELRRPPAWLALAALNLAPLLLFANRFVPRADLAQWERLRAGGPAQLTALTPERLDDRAPTEFARVFPMETAAFHRQHVVHGYAAMQPAALFHHPPEKMPPRFSWRSGAARPIVVTAETLNTLELSFPAAAEDALIRTDSFFPGWSAGKQAGIASEIPVAAGATSLHLRYKPTHLRAALIACGIAGICVSLLLWRRARS